MCDGCHCNFINITFKFNDKLFLKDRGVIAEMQKPDANGFVNITWPSQNIPHGGIFHTRVVEPSTDKQQFLKVLLEESKLDIELRKKSAAKKEVIEEKKGPEVPTVRPRTSRRRSLSAIRESGALDIDDYKPLKKGEDREKLKELLARTMECGDNTQEPTVVVIPKGGKKPVEKKLPTNKEKWNELLTQIRERAEWLAEMEYLGEADPHRDIIKEQIAERMRALDALGVESNCSTARSTASGFSTTRSREVVAAEKQPARKPPTQRSNTSAKSLQKIMRSTRRNDEENVSAYSSAQLSPLQYSPRRRQ